jgi:hypothetical protein
MKLCTHVSADRIPCPALAADDSVFCPVHRDHPFLERVSKRGTKPPVLCVRCQEEIFPGTLKKNTPAGPVHAEFVCIAKQQK